MAKTASGRVSYVPEAGFGITPSAPQLQTLRCTGATFSYDKSVESSKQVDTDRALPELVVVGSSASGSIEIEYSPDSYDDLFEAAVCGEYAPSLYIPSNNAALTGNTLTSKDAFVFAEPGQWLLLQGWGVSANNGWKQISAVLSADAVEIAGARGDETPSTAGAVTGQTVRSGLVDRSFSLQVAYEDVGRYGLFVGQRLGSLSLNLAVGDVAKGEATFSGKGVSVGASAFGTEVAKTTTRVLNCQANVGDIYIDGVLSPACFKSLSVTIDNRLRTRNCIGADEPENVVVGLQRVTGTLDRLFVDFDLYRKMVNHEPVSIAFGITNEDGGIHVYLPRVYFTSGGPDLSNGQDSEVVKKMAWEAVRFLDPDLDSPYNIRIDTASNLRFGLLTELSSDKLLTEQEGLLVLG